MMMPLLNACLIALLGTPARAACAQTEAKVMCEDLKKPFFQILCDTDGTCTAKPMRAQTLAREFPAEKPADTIRMFILGESAATLLGGGAELNENVPGFEMINCGMSGYESHRITGVFKEVLKYKPDLIVLLSGNSEDGGYPCDEFSFTMRSRYRAMLEKFYGWKSGAGPAPVRASLKIHETRLTEMAALAGKRKVPLILCTLPANLSGIPPSGTPPLEKESFAAGLAAFEKRKFEPAAGLFEQSLREDPRDLFSRFYLARTFEALKRFNEAKIGYLRALGTDSRQDRTSPERNEMIRKVAARWGAGLCDLERAFYNVSKNGIPGFEQFSDATFWRPSYTSLVWDEILKSAGAMGLAAFKDLPAYPLSQILPDDELKKDFSNALAAIDNPFLCSPAATHNCFLCEKALAEIEFMEARRPGMLERTSLSEEAFKNFFIRSLWSQGIASRLGRLRPQFIAHLAEVQRRRGNFKKSLTLSERAIALDPDRLYFRLVKALALAGLDRKKEAQKELAALYPVPALRKRAGVLGKAYGLALPDAEASPAEIKESKKSADSGVDKIKAGDPAAARELLAEAVKLNPLNAEAFLSLCSVQFSKKDFPAALRSCDAARWGADSYYPDARKMLISEASYMKAQILAKMGRREAARNELKRALKDPPPAWRGLEAAAAELKKLDK
ncbi:MAG: tetratricopeptide repeat protein [Elusimicrobia bacterium]|nr:tetratricopeptide repeat protein [Elusimicrobiota bacterium]